MLFVQRCTCLVCFDKSYNSVTEIEGNTSSWMVLVAMANENVENGINSDIADGAHNDWTNFQSDYDLDAEGIFDNDDQADAFVCMAYTGDPEDEDDNNNGEFQEVII